MQGKVQNRWGEPRVGESFSDPGMIGLAQDYIDERFHGTIRGKRFTVDSVFIAIGPPDAVVVARSDEDDYHTFDGGRAISIATMSGGRKEKRMDKGMSEGTAIKLVEVLTELCGEVHLLRQGLVGGEDCTAASNDLSVRGALIAAQSTLDGIEISLDAIVDNLAGQAEGG